MTEEQTLGERLVYGAETGVFSITGFDGAEIMGDGWLNVHDGELRYEVTTYPRYHLVIAHEKRAGVVVSFPNRAEMVATLDHLKEPYFDLVISLIFTENILTVSMIRDLLEPMGLTVSRFIGGGDVSYITINKAIKTYDVSRRSNEGVVTCEPPLSNVLAIIKEGLS